MSKFAKLFDVEETQVLAMVTQDADGNASLRFTTQVLGSEMSISFCFGADDDDSWAKADEGLKQLDQEMANAFYKEQIDQFGGGIVNGLLNRNK
jgi:hypothetical protein